MSLKNKNWKIRSVDVGSDKWYGYKDIQDTISDWRLYVKIINLLATKRIEEARKLEPLLMKKYNCEWHELGWEKIWGVW